MFYCVMHVILYLLCLLFCDSEFLWNTASALVAVSSFLRASGHVMFVGNNAKSGSCMYLLLGSRVSLMGISTFIHLCSRVQLGCYYNVMY